MSHPKLPQGAGNQPTAKASLWWLNVKPLTEPISAFSFAAHQMRNNEQLQNAPQEVRDQFATHATFLEYIASQVDFEAKNPVVLLAMSKAATDAGLRQRMIQALAELESTIATMQQQQTG